MKNKKGFTLIELLAVIVVLAIILVIAGTNAIKYINSTKENAKYIAAKEIVAIAEAYMETNNLNVVTVGELMSDEVGYLEKDATNPRTGENSWNSKDKEQYIFSSTNAIAQTDSKAQADSFYSFDGYYYFVNTNIEYNSVKNYGGKNSCLVEEILINGNCITINSNLVDSDTPEVEENELDKDEVDSSFEIKSCSEYQDMANTIYEASLTYFKSNVLPIQISELINSNTAISNLKNPLKENGEWVDKDKVVKNPAWNQEKKCQEFDEYYRYNYQGYYILIYK